MSCRCMAILLLLVIAGCSSSQPPALSDGDRGTEDFLEYLQADKHEDTVDLDVAEMAALPDGTLLLAGAYSQGWGQVRTALFVSRDGGLSWQDSGMGYLSRCFNCLGTRGDSDVWLIEGWAIESYTPEHLIISHDGGKTWAALPLDLHLPTGLYVVTSLEFSDAENGRLVADMDDETRQADGFTTADGGRTWRHTGKVQTPAAADVPAGPEGVVATCLLPAKDGKAAGCIRLRTEKNAEGLPESYVIEKQDAPGGPWQGLSRIPVQYKVLPGNRLQPVCPRQD